MIEKQPVHKETPGIGDEQVEGLKELFPQIVTEGKIDFDKLREALGDEVDSRPERYGKNDLFICRDKAMTDEFAANLALQCRLKTI